MRTLIRIRAWLCLAAPIACSSPDDSLTEHNNSGAGGTQQQSQTGGGSSDGSGGSTSPSSGGGSISTGGVSSGGQESSSGGATLATGGAAPGGSMNTGGQASSGGTTSSVEICQVPSTLKAAAACNGKLVGAALAASHLNDGAYTTAAKEHNYVTPENEMKWDTVEGQQGQFNFGPGDQIVNFAVQNDLKVKGHALVWHNQLPGWVSSLSSEAAVRSAMLNHIEKVAGHYKGKVVAWDVVNEAILVDEKITGNGNARFRDSVFYNYLGETFIDEAFEAAHVADPDAKLFYNEFGAEGLNDKSDKVYELVQGLIARDVPIDGVGLQTHIGKPNPSPSASEIAANIKRLTDLGLEVQISELDINGCDNVSPMQQEQVYHDIVAACVAEPLCTAVTMWGITDKYSWVNSFNESGCNGQSAHALLWDDNYTKKGSYDAVMKALTGN